MHGPVWPNPLAFSRHRQGTRWRVGMTHFLRREPLPHEVSRTGFSSALSIYSNEPRCTTYRNNLPSLIWDERNCNPARTPSSPSRPARPRPDTNYAGVYVTLRADSTRSEHKREPLVRLAGELLKRLSRSNARPQKRQHGPLPTPSQTSSTARLSLPSKKRDSPKRHVPAI